MPSSAVITENNLERRISISTHFPTKPLEEETDNSRDPRYRLHLTFINLGEIRRPECYLDIYKSELDFSIRNFILMSIVHNPNFIPDNIDNSSISGDKYTRLLDRMHDLQVKNNGYASEREQLTDLKLKLSTNKKLIAYYNPPLYSNIEPFQFTNNSIISYLKDNNVNISDDFNNLRQVKQSSLMKENNLKMYSIVFMYEYPFGETGFGQKLNDV